MNRILSALLFVLFSIVTAAGASAQCGVAMEAEAMEVEATLDETLIKEAFTPERFAELQEAGEFVLVDVFATWCPTCAQQQKVLKQFREEHPLARVHMLQVDFDDQKEWVTHFKAPRQSTLILFKGEERLWFSVAQTDKDKIFAALNEALAGGSPDENK